jgi:hypothetical protein
MPVRLSGFIKVEACLNKKEKPNYLIQGGQRLHIEGDRRDGMAEGNVLIGPIMQHYAEEANHWGYWQDWGIEDGQAEGEDTLGESVGHIKGKGVEEAVYVGLRLSRVRERVILEEAQRVPHKRYRR